MFNLSAFCSRCLLFQNQYHMVVLTSSVLVINNRCNPKHKTDKIGGLHDKKTNQDPVVQGIVSLKISLGHKFVKQISAKVTNTL